jgi:hypothetical protein
MSALPEGYVDPTDPAAVAEVLAATVASGGLAAVSDLLARLPGVRAVEAVPRGFLRAGLPAALWLGDEWCWWLSEPPALAQVVNGVELHRAVVRPGDAAASLSRVVAELVRRTAAVADASAVLTAARDLST